MLADAGDFANILRIQTLNDQFQTKIAIPEKKEPLVASRKEALIGTNGIVLQGQSDAQIGVV